MRGAEQIFAISPSSADALADVTGVARERVAVLPIPVELDRFTPLLDSEWRSLLHEPTIVFVGRGSDPRKNLGLLVEAFRILRQRLPRARLRLVGDPPPRRLVEVAGVEATGPVASVADEVRRAAVFVLPSRQEGFGVVVAEAFACGVPAVVTPCGGPEELVRASGGGLVLESFQAEELAAVLSALLKQGDVLEQMRLAARTYVEREHSQTRLNELLAPAFDQLRAVARRS